MKYLLLLLLLAGGLLFGRSNKSLYAAPADVSHSAHHSEQHSDVSRSENNYEGFRNTGAVTSVGVPAGVPVSKQIGAEGGLLISSDGRVRLRIPAGALSNPTQISIVPWTNEAPGGIGLAYQLTPEETGLKSPAMLSFSCTHAGGGDAETRRLSIAFQDDLFRWQANDALHKPVALGNALHLPIPHFKVWALMQTPVQDSIARR